jgi:uncharacterized protein (TIGR02996 family)
MTDRAGFLQAIREAPDDIALRLVFADWLEEQGDPLADFIRLQFEVERLREQGDDHLRQLEWREWEMLWEHRSDWLGPLGNLLREPGYDPFWFRRGLVETAAVPVELFLEWGEEIRRRCPVLRELALFNVRDRGRELAQCPHLAGLATLELADWPTGEDARALAASRHLVGVRNLRIWLGSQHDETVGEAFARASSPQELRELHLLQLFGGLMATRILGSADDAELLDSQADDLAGAVNRLRGQDLACVHRPFDRLYPLRGEVGHDFYAGRILKGLSGLAEMRGDDRLLLVMFDPWGAVLDCRRLRGRDPLERLRQRFQFEPALIRVPEFDTMEGGISVHLFDDWHCQVLANPDAPTPPDGDARAEMGPLIYHWLRQGNFVIDSPANNYWAGPDGRIHSS